MIHARAIVANSGYVYSDAAYSHLTFQVIGSRLVDNKGGWDGHE